MNLQNIFLQTLSQFWFIIPFLLFVGVIRSPWFKGVFGEFLVNKLLTSLPETDYTLIKNVTLPTEDGTTQIDHIVISKFGIFVIETKNMKGWIFGSAHQKQWTQKIYRHSTKFQNPLHQNYKHIKTLESVLDCNAEHIHSVIVFIGDSHFKTEMPNNVTYARGCLGYIKEFNQVVFSDTEVETLITRLNEIKMKPSLVTDYKHRKHVKELVATKETEVTNPTCPRCGSTMIVRETKKGTNAGKKFLGCSEFPKCRGMSKLE